MKRSILWLILAGLAALLIIAGFRQVRRSRTELPKSISQLQDEQGVPVEVRQAYIDTFTLSRGYLGTVEGARQGDVMAPIMEKIVEMPVQVGQRVQKGQVVARLDTKAALPQYSQARLAYEDAQREAQRMENLFAAGAVSEQMLEKAKLARDVAQQNLESSSELVSLTSPIEGVVTEIFYREGETTKMGEAVLRVADLNQLRVKFEINYDDRKMIRESTPVFLRISGNGIKEIPAGIAAISLSADPVSRLFSIWVNAANIEALLQPGLLVDVRLIVVQKPQTLMVPRDAVLTRNDRAGVFLVQDDGRAVFTPLRLGLDNATEMEVLEGLQAGQTVVSYGQNNLNDGELVKIIEL